MLIRQAESIEYGRVFRVIPVTVVVIHQQNLRLAKA